MGSGWVGEVRVALRSLARYPAFAVVTVLTLALGIGANTAVFTLVDGVLLSPLAFERPEELVAIEHTTRDGPDQLPMSQGLYVLYRDQAPSVRAIGLFAGTAVNLAGEGDPERVQAQAVTPGFFQALAVDAALGRTFMEEEGRPDPEPVVMLSDGLWRSRFGGAPEVVGTNLDVNGVSRRIVGVMPRGFGFPDATAQLWVPLVVDETTAPLGAFGAGGVARLAEGRTLQGLQTELDGLVARLTELFPEAVDAGFMQQVGLAPRVSPLKEALVGDLSSTLWILLATVGLVLLIACANVANLLLVRAESRSRELALRMALGAGHAQVLRSFMSESLVLAAAGGALGVAIGAAAVRGVGGLLPSDLPRMAEIGVDLRVLGFTAVLSLGCAFFFGVFPMLRARSSALATQLRSGGGRNATGGAERHRLRSGLVVAQMALALVLLIGSGLMIRSFQALRSVDPGFDAERVLVAQLSVPTGEMPEWEAAAGFFRTLGDRLRSQPGVEAVGFGGSVPLAGGIGYFNLQVEDHPRGDTELPILATQNFVEEGYFEALGIPLLAGRTFRAGDGAEGTRAVVVGQAFAERWWPGQSALGRRMRLGGGEEDWHVIVGVVGDARYSNLEEAPGDQVYWPATFGPAAAPQATRTMELVMKTAGDPLASMAMVRREVQELHGRIPVSNPRSMEQVVAEAGSRTSFTAALLGVASGIALLLGLVGIYGVVSYIVAQRTREIGVRMALGATGGSVRALVVRQGMVLAGVGVLIGLAAAGLLSRVLASLLYGVGATDPVTYATVTVLLLAISALATWIPAMRASRVQPSTALRGE